MKDHLKLLEGTELDLIYFLLRPILHVPLFFSKVFLSNHSKCMDYINGKGENTKNKLGPLKILEHMHIHTHTPQKPVY